MLTFLSIGAYIFIGYKGSVVKGLACALIITLVMGIFDASIGWEISKKLKANFGKHREKSLQLTLEQRLMSTFIFLIFFGFTGHLIAAI